MRAVLIKDDKGPVGNLYVGEATKPVARSGEVLVKIKAFGLNRVDILQREGEYPRSADSPSILGVEFSGNISELGPGVSGWTVDEEVLGLVGGGAYAEYIVVPSTHILRKPKHLSFAEAASIPENFLTALQAVILYGEIKNNEDVLVHAGASGVGVAVIQLSRVYGAQNVLATASTKEKLDWLLSIPNGATHAFNYKTQDFAAETKSVTNNKGVDLVIDFVGQSHWNQNIDALALDGRMIILGQLSGLTVPSVNLGPVLYKRLRIQGSTLRSRAPKYQAELIARFDSEVLQRITGENGVGPIKTYIHRVYPWTSIQEAHLEMEANKNSGKIVVEVV